MTRHPTRTVWLWALFAASLFYSVASSAQTTFASEFATWTCTSAPCPWGPTDTSHAIAWPATAQPIAARLGYTVSPAAYLPARFANGAQVKVITGSANVYVGAPSAASHYYLGTINAGQTFTVTGIAASEVVSVQSADQFTYQLTLPTPQTTGSASQLLSWNCTGSPCPWGQSSSAHAIVWPSTTQPVSTRLGYTVSAGAYLPAAAANGATVKITNGTAGLYAGTPNAPSHVYLGELSAGQSAEISGLAADAVLSVQSDVSFLYEVTYAAAPPPPPPPPPPASGTASQFVTWSCTGSPCPWGSTDTGHAIVWPDAEQPIANRLGYTVNYKVYLPAASANGLTVKINSGVAGLYAGSPDTNSHRLLATIAQGESFQVSGLLASEVLSVQNSGSFAYELTFEAPPPVDPPPPPTGTIMDSVNALWRCDTPSCFGADWVGPVINWPSWAAYSNNDRTGNGSRTVYSASTGEKLYPYMGSWANGCQVTAVSGTVLIIEWERGSETWRETFLEPGESHTITLIAPEDGAMIESYDYGPPFSVALNNCTPQPLP